MNAPDRHVVNRCCLPGKRRRQSSVSENFTLWASGRPHFGIFHTGWHEIRVKGAAGQAVWLYTSTKLVILISQSCTVVRCYVGVCRHPQSVLAKFPPLQHVFFS